MVSGRKIIFTLLSQINLASNGKNANIFMSLCGYFVYFAEYVKHASLENRRNMSSPI